MSVITRVASAQDAAALAGLNAAFNGASDPADLIAGRMAAFSHLERALIAEVGGRVAGFACLRVVPCILYADPHAELTELYVDSAFRRRGVATALVRLAEGLAREHGARELMLLAGAENAQALAFYRALGYEEDDISLRKRL